MPAEPCSHSRQVEEGENTGAWRCHILLKYPCRLRGAVERRPRGAACSPSRRHLALPGNTAESLPG